MEPDTALRREQAPAGAERRHLTVVFCDLVDSTALGEQLDPEDFGELIAAYHSACAEVIARFHGHVAQYQGDGVLALFGYPHAQGDDAVHAVRAGLELVRAVEALADPRLVARVGIHTGVVVMSQTGAVGDTVNLAARLEKFADPGTVVVSAATERVTRGYFVLSGIDPARLKGIAEPVTPYRVVDDAGVRTRLALAAAAGLTPLIGREDELEELKERWRLARTGQGQAVVVRGDPGIGKSRVVHELGRHVGDEGTRLVFQSSPYYATSALHPVVEELERVFRIDGRNGDAESLARLTDELELQGIEGTEARSALAALLSIAEGAAESAAQAAPQEQKRQTFAALMALLVAETKQRPVLAVFEDLHWADPSTLELVGLIAAEAPARRLLLVMTARPEFQPAWSPEAGYEVLDLAGLDREQVDDLIAAVLGGRSLARHVRTEIADRAAGVPLFVEETLKMILESGDDHELPIPGTLQNPLAARLDGLGQTKELAQLASVAAQGGEFGYDLLRAVSYADEEVLRAGLDELVRAQLLYERGSFPDTAYVFKHALIREAAYGSLLRSARRRFHGRIADVLLESFPDIVETKPELVARHLAEAGRALEAVGYWQRSGERALQAWATNEAAAHFERGLELVASFPEGPETKELELGFQLARGTALMAARGYAAPEAEAAYARAEELSREVADPARLGPALYGLGAFYASTAQPRKAHDFGRRLHALADAGGDEDVLVEARVILGVAEFLQGDLAAAEASFERVLSRWEPEKHRAHIFTYGQEPGVVSLTMRALTSGWLGRLDEALRFARDAETSGREVAHPLTFAYTLAGVGILYQLLGDVGSVERTADELVAVSTEHGLPMWLAWGRTMRGWALLERAETEAGMAEITVGVAAAEVVHSSVMKIHFLSQLGEAFGRIGYVQEGIAMVEEGFADLEPTQERVSEAELHRSRGLLHLAEDGNEAQAEASFRRGIDVASARRALLLELRSATALAELLAAQGRGEEARALLEEVNGRFDEGQDTPVLAGARRVLERLGASSSPQPR